MEIGTTTVGSVRTITLDRPHARNALTVAMRLALRDALEAADADPEVRVVVITGAEGHFCAGGDITEFGNLNAPDDAYDYAVKIAQPVFRTLRGMRTPTIARVEGVAAGAGMFLALGCDVVVAAEDARFIAAHLRLGVPPDWGGIWLLPRLVGLTRAKSLLLTGREMDARRAAAWGLISECVQHDQLEATVEGYCNDIAAFPDFAVGLTRRALDRSLDTALDDFLDWEAGTIAMTLLTEDHKQRVHDFVNTPSGRRHQHQEDTDG